MLQFSAYEDLGCWKDEIERAMPLLEGNSTHLDVHYKRRKNPIKQCALAALEKGVKTFALQDGGQCFGTSLPSYKKYGISSYCDQDGTGGPMANNAYVFGMFSLKYFFSSVSIIVIACKTPLHTQ